MSIVLPERLEPIRAPRSPLRIGFWGTRSAFSTIVLTTLLKQYPITQVVLPASAPDAPGVAELLPPALSRLHAGADQGEELLLVQTSVAPDTLQMAWHHQLSAYQVGRLSDPAVADWLAGWALDIICVACFPWRIPPALLAMPTYGCLNIHPAWLPAHRGPVPIFWQLRAGARSLGVTIHQMDADFDTGPIVAQQRVDLPDGAPGPVADRLCAQTGATLLVELLQQLVHGGLPSQAQPPGGSYQGWPTAADFRLDATWSAQHAYNFMRGTAEWQQPYAITVDHTEMWLHSALAYLADQTLATPVERQGATVLIQFQPGVLQAVPWRL